MEEIARLAGPRDLVFNEHRIMTPVMTATVAVLCSYNYFKYEEGADLGWSSGCRTEENLYWLQRTVSSDLGHNKSGSIKIMLDNVHIIGAIGQSKG